MKSLEIPAEKARLKEVTGFVLDFAEKLGFDKKELFQLKLCTEEIFVNVASYAYKPDPEKNRPLSLAKKGGLGIFLTKRFMDEVSYAYQDGKNVLTIKKNHSQAESTHE